MSNNPNIMASLNKDGTMGKGAHLTGARSNIRKGIFGKNTDQAVSKQTAKGM